MAQPCIRILATGGTIAGTSGSATGKAYRAGQIGIGALLEEARALGLGMACEGRQIAAIGSQDIGWAEWDALHRECSEALADEGICGVVITHGTDTAEETAFLLDRTLPTSKPIVLTGAMRPADALGSDGMRNLATALRVAADTGAAGRGVLVAMGDQVFAARDVRKAATQGPEAFRGYPRGSIAAVSPSSLEWFGPPARSGEAALFDWPAALPRVDVIYAAAAMDRVSVDAALAAGANGIVLAGLGQGNAPRGVLEALGEAVARGVAVVRSSRTDQGQVDRNVEVDDDDYGFVAARALNPAKSRILLQLLLASGVSDPASIQATYDN
ncbi:asparaginase [Altererythrobacter salegens]|uniref:Asparaginase n=1 Tax=Croceibacterium salegens TaxID=1737568 RepID=A0A6I4SX37_9SPHN|nr:asparaginase [Croceibacterium salegens]MXO59396.1 asparaginase [Croceibacterium salegens]